MGAAEGYVGKGIALRGAARFLKGGGRYVSDLGTSDDYHVSFLRSTYAHARIARLDAKRARSHPQAIAVFTAEDLEKVLVDRYWGGWRGSATADYCPLAKEKVRWAGEPVAAIVAPSRYLAEDIAELVDVEYEPLPAVVDAEKSLNSPDALLYDEWGSNVYYHDDFVGGELKTAFAQASGVIHRRFSSQRHTAAPLETRGIVAHYDRDLGQLRVHANWQDVFVARSVISNILDLPQSKVHITAPDCGGGFGVKVAIYPEELVTCAIAVLLDCSLKWIQDRQEDLVGTNQARDMIVDAELAHDSNGKILGLKVEILGDAGAYGLPARGNAVEGMMVAQDLVAAGYDIPAYAYSLDVVMTNKAPIGPYRGVGQPMTSFVLNQLIDEVASGVGLDRREVRQRNLLKDDQFPYTCLTGSYVIEKGSYVQALERALDLIGFDDFPEFQRKMRQLGRYVGLGVACGGKPHARGAAWYGARGVPISGQEGCAIQVNPDGRVYAQFGTTDQGQGIETALAQILADQIGVNIDEITINMGDTASSPYGAGAWSSRQAALGGTAACMAAQKVRKKILDIAAFQLECAPEDLILGDSRVSVNGSPHVFLTLEQIARTAYFVASELPDGIEPTLEEVAHFAPPAATFSNAAHAAVIELDPHTGQILFRRYVIVDDCGTVLNPQIVEGQVHGATAQGIGGAIYEHSVYDEYGQPLATTFMDYLIPTSQEIPHFEMDHIETPSPHIALGVKGAGESGTVFAPATIASAVADALKAEVNRVQFSPSAIYELVQRAAGEENEAGPN